jgi:hypothetical protein
MRSPARCSRFAELLEAGAIDAALARARILQRASPLDDSCSRSRAQRPRAVTERSLRARTAR